MGGLGELLEVDRERYRGEVDRAWLFNAVYGEEIALICRRPAESQDLLLPFHRKETIMFKP